MRNIPMIFTDELSCITSPIISVMDWKKFNYELAFVNAWDFSFSDKDPNFPNSIGPRILTESDSISDSLLSFYNVKLQLHNCDDSSEIYSIVQENIYNKSPIIVFTDLYNCPWARSYKKTHLKHACLVVDFDAAGNLYCIDAGPTCKGAIMSLQDFHDSCSGYLSINLNEYKQNPVNWYTIIDKSILQIKNSLTNLADFINYFAANFNIEAEIETSKHYPDGSTILWKVDRISGGRKLFSLTLKHLGENNRVGELITLSNELLIISALWKKVKLLIAKCIYSSNQAKIKNAIQDNLTSILSLEQQAADKIVEVCKKYKNEN